MRGASRAPAARVIASANVRPAWPVGTKIQVSAREGPKPSSHFAAGRKNGSSQPKNTRRIIAQQVRQPNRVWESGFFSMNGNQTRMARD